MVLGANSVVLPSTTVGDGVLLSAQSTLNKDASDWGLYHGVPAKRVATSKGNIGLSLGKQFWMAL